MVNQSGSSEISTSVNLKQNEAGVAPIYPPEVTPGSTITQTDSEHRNENGCEDSLWSRLKTKLLTTRDDGERGRFKTQSAYQMTAIGYAVGLGNVWRFPAMAYEHGGGAFLIPYFCCAFTFAFPLYYIEAFTGQYVNVGASQLYYKFMPVLQGIGWAMMLERVQFLIYYSIIVGWALLYFVDLLLGTSSEWTTCDNKWNTVGCRPGHLERSMCGLHEIYFNKTCYSDNDTQGIMEKIRLPAEEYFENVILLRSEGIEHMTVINWKLLGAMVVVWLICSLIIWKGVNTVGGITHFTTTIPFFIIGLYCVRGLYLPGMKKGLDFILLKPDFQAVLSLKTWNAALRQVFVSLNPGTGGIPTLASFRQPNPDAYRDAIIVVLADTVMSIMGAMAVFTTLGYMSEVTGKPLESLVKSGYSLTFITYPEAMAGVTFSRVWTALFFIMLLCLGTSSIIVDQMSIVTSLLDQFSWCRSNKTLTHFLVSLLLFCGGIVCCTDAGIYIFTLMDECTGGFMIAVGLFLEMLLFAYFYGVHEILRDIRDFFHPSRCFLFKIFGKDGWFFWFAWKFWVPALCFCCRVAYHMVKVTAAANILGYLYGNMTVIPLVAFFFINLFAMRRDAGTWWAGFRVHPSHPSYKRIQKLHKKDESLPSKILRVLCGIDTRMIRSESTSGSLPPHKTEKRHN